MGLGPPAAVREPLMESFDETAHNEISPAWREEIQKRSRELDEGLVELRDAEDVFAKAYGLIR